MVKIWNWKRNFSKVGTGTITFSKVGTGTVKNSYGSTILLKRMWRGALGQAGQNEGRTPIVPEDSCGLSVT
jgi:hypothetical protein